jgi:cation transport ATPase
MNPSPADNQSGNRRNRRGQAAWHQRPSQIAVPVAREVPIHYGRAGARVAAPAPADRDLARVARPTSRGERALMYWLLSTLSYVAGLISLVCFIIVLIKMFQSNMTGMAVACIVLAFCGIGEIVALVLAWQNAGRWRLQQNFLMLYTVSLAAAYLLWPIAYFAAPRVVVVTG